MHVIAMRTLTSLVFLSLAFSLASARAPAVPRVLLLTGGCWHNYTVHETSLRNAFIRAGVAVSWTVVKPACTKPVRELGLVYRPRWTSPYDLVIANGCYDSQRPGYIDAFARGFQTGVPLVALHCAIHSFYKAPPNEHWKWHQVLGISSLGHEGERRYPVRVIAGKSEIMRPFNRARGMHWMPKDELYRVDRVWKHTRVMAYTRSVETNREYPVFWTNLYWGRTRVFATSFGHSDATWRDKVFTDTVVRGALWGLGRLRDNSWFTWWWGHSW